MNMMTPRRIVRAALLALAGIAVVATATADGASRASSAGAIQKYLDTLPSTDGKAYLHMLAPLPTERTCFSAAAWDGSDAERPCVRIVARRYRVTDADGQVRYSGTVPGCIVHARVVGVWEDGSFRLRGQSCDGRAVVVVSIGVKGR